MPDSNDNAGASDGSGRRSAGSTAGAASAAAQREAIRAKARQRITAAVAAGAVVVIVAIVLGLAGSHKKAAGTNSRTHPTTAVSKVSTGSGSTTCAYTAARQAAKDVGRPPTAVAPATYKATMTTNQGVVVAELAGGKAPCTVNSFVYLASHKYFDGTSCHRLTTSGIFVLQCGDPSGTGRGGPGYQFADENLAGATYPAGTIAMANAGPGTNGSQFFLVYKDTQLSPAYTPFGTVTSGLDVLNAIAARGSDNSNGPGDGKPALPVQIKSVTVAAES